MNNTDDKTADSLAVNDKRLIADETESAVVVQESPNEILLMAMKQKYEPAFIKEMLVIQIAYEKNEARKAYFDAVANFKAEAPKLKKDKVNAAFNNSPYTSLGLMLETFNPPLGQHGLSLSHPKIDVGETTITAVCRLSHRLGHTESLPITVPIDQSPVGGTSNRKVRTPIQDIKTSLTYLRSITVEAILGITGTEASTHDNDGNSAEKAYLTEDQVKEIKKKLKDLKIDKSAFLGYMGKAFKCDEFSDVDKIPATGYAAAISVIRAKEKEGKK